MGFPQCLLARSVARTRLSVMGVPSQGGALIVVPALEAFESDCIIEEYSERVTSDIISGLTDVVRLA